MPKLTVYGLGASAPFRAVCLTLDALGLNYNFKEVNILKGEQMKPEFLKLNPEHTVPVLQDDDFVLTESRAIGIYLASRYDAERSLIPACKKKAAKVHQMLYFDACVLAGRAFPMMRERVFTDNKKPLSDDEKKQLTEAMNYLEGYLKPTGFVAGTDTYSLADLALLGTYSSLDATGKVLLNWDDFLESRKWFKKMKELVPNYEEACGEGAKFFGEMFKEKTGL